ncbi:MAG TPA: hypothetical protein VK509_11385, partial [Polyangiales bacterium]|nr:hypothetical protein [Polyangiales bacterium]
AIRRQLSGSLDLIVQQSRFADGARRVTSISEVADIDEHGELQLHEIYGFERGAGGGEDGEPGRFRATGHLPSFAAELEPAFELALSGIGAARPGGAP